MGQAKRICLIKDGILISLSHGPLILRKALQMASMHALTESGLFFFFKLPARLIDSDK